jgi:uncharacterized RDD family membrane protein YckC
VRLHLRVAIFIDREVYTVPDQPMPTDTQIMEIKDVKTMVTPYAFKIADSVLYTPLASPWKRALAMAIDGLLIGVLAEETGGWFLLLVAAVLFLQHQSHLWDKSFKWLLYTLMLLTLVWSIGSSVYDSKEQVTQTDDSLLTSVPQGMAVLSLVPTVISLEECTSTDCAKEALLKVRLALENAEMTGEDRSRFLHETIADLDFSLEEKAELMGAMGLDSAMAGTVPSLPKVNYDVDGVPSVTGTEIPAAKGKVANVIPAPEEDKLDSYSLLGWAKGIMKDLGLGFGWSAFYFTVFVAWFDGQTLGKKLLRIRVIQLDGKKLGLWSAFGRYGGYGAGLATGLLGFLQIFWDANRQAIQDKISATVVIDLAKARTVQQDEELMQERPA